MPIQVLRSFAAGLVVSLLVQACTSKPEEERGISYSADDLALINGIFLDPVSQTQRRGSVVIRNGVIIAQLKRRPDTFPGKVINLEGKWVIPGLIDMHTHSFGNQIPGPERDSPGTEEVSRRVLKAGVTGLVDLFGYEEALLEVRDRQRSGAFIGAEIFTSLSCLTAPEGHCAEYGIPTRTMTTPREAASVVTDLAKRGPDVVKIVYQPTDDQPSIDKATFASAVATASRLGLKTIIHIKTWQDVRDAVSVGATAITHVPRGDIPADIPGRLADSGTVIIPTLTVGTDFADFLFDPEVLDAPLARRLAPKTLFSAYRDPELTGRYQDRRDTFEKRNATTVASIRKLKEAGVTVLAGTDSGNWGTIQGYSVHREMIILTEAGFSPFEALAAATTWAGEFLGIKSGVTPGSRASLVILSASPLDDIRNTQEIELVIHQGEVVYSATETASAE